MARSSRLRACALAAVAVAVLLLCLAADWRFRPTGAARIAMWSAGLLAYAVLLHRVAGPVVDHRDRQR